MSAPAWTSGPWRAVVRSNQAGPRSVAVATDAGQGGSWEPHGVRVLTAQNVADARLIAAAPDFAAASASLIEAWDARTTGAQQIITGKSDADLQKQAMAAIDGLRAALAKAGAQ